ncbi:hypothetical protein LPJ61_001919 [Coemansia biformis]|uniref:Integrase catalytic domain-containing protein n=1 Tax=Coemansia biformis TaxID=1286918 RepID=A0A9W7YFZ6_9FUNG|nr:hypothetical protein LPJ61_001919 [Coemansia biformis]
MVMSQLHHPCKHLYVDFLHVRRWGNEALDALITVDSASRYMEVYPLLDMTASSLTTTLHKGWFAAHGTLHFLTSNNRPQLVSAAFEQFLAGHGIQHICMLLYLPQSDLAESTVKKFKMLLQQCWADDPARVSWTQFIPCIIATYAVMCAKTMANTPAAVFFSHEATSSDDTFVLWPFKGVVPTEEQLAYQMFKQVQSHCTMVCTWANAHMNCGVHRQWFKPGEWVMMWLQPIPTNLAALFAHQRGPFCVVAHHSTTYLLTWHDGIPLPAPVPGNTLMLYLMDKDMALEDLLLAVAGDLKGNSAGLP